MNRSEIDTFFKLEETKRLQHVCDKFFKNSKISPVGVIKKKYAHDINQIETYLNRFNLFFDSIKDNSFKLLLKIYFLRNAEFKVGECKICKLPFIKIYHNKHGKILKLCKHVVIAEQSSNKSNKTFYSTNVITKNINLILGDKNSFSINETTLLEKIETQFKLNSNFSISKSRLVTPEELCWILWKTKNILKINVLDLNDVNFKNLKFSERVFILKTKIDAIPTCNECKTQLKFLSFFKGYSSRCPMMCVKFWETNRLEKVKNISFEKVSVILENSKFEWLNRKDFLGIYADKLKLKCKNCGTITERCCSRITSQTNFKDFFCSQCCTISSKGQNELFHFIKQFYPSAVFNFGKTVLFKQELDIYIPELKLAFEYNGVYWHSETFKDKHYHKNKIKLCLEHEIRLIHIWENDWLNKRELIKKKIKHILKLSENKIYARKCVIKEITTFHKNVFLEKHHIQGADKSSVKLGLFYQDELVSVMTFAKPRFNKNYQWELVRFASSMSVVGGAGKLLKYFERNFNPESIITYADADYSQGSLYEKLCFSFKHWSDPDYFWVKNDLILSRYQTQKHKLSKLVETFYPELSEHENMVENGFLKVYKSGNLVYEKIKEK